MKVSKYFIVTLCLEALLLDFPVGFAENNRVMEVVSNQNSLKKHPQPKEIIEKHRKNPAILNQKPNNMMKRGKVALTSLSQDSSRNLMFADQQNVHKPTRFEKLKTYLRSFKSTKTSATPQAVTTPLPSSSPAHSITNVPNNKKAPTTTVHTLSPMKVKAGEKHHHFFWFYHKRKTILLMAPCPEQVEAQNRVEASKHLVFRKMYQKAMNCFYDIEPKYFKKK